MLDVDILGDLLLDVDHLRQLGSDSLVKGEVHVEVVGVYHADRNQLLGFLQEDRGVDLLVFYLPFGLKSHLHLGVGDPIGVYIHSVKDLLLYRQDVKMPQCL